MTDFDLPFGNAALGLKLISREQLSLDRIVALNVLPPHSGTQFDPQVVAAFEGIAQRRVEAL